MILVTGAGGLVGTHVLAELLRKGEKIRAMKRPGKNTDLVFRILGYYGFSREEIEKIEWMDCDITDYLAVEDAMEGIDKVYHCAAIVSFVPGDSELIYKTNVEGTANVVNSCLEKKIKKLCYTSSVAAIGRSKATEPITENTKWKNAPENSWYAISKYNAEREVWRGIEEGLNAVMVNPCIILGPSDWKTSSSELFRTVYKGLSFYTKGSNAFVDVRDVAKTMVLLMDSDISAERFLCTSENMTYQDNVNLIADALGKKRPHRYAKPWMTELAWRIEKILAWIGRRKPRVSKETARAAHHHSVYSSEKIKARLNYTFISVKQSVENAAGYYISQFSKR